jgi:ubiquinone/menaquinone biosynthesis C-methylase UbiE
MYSPKDYWTRLAEDYSSVDASGLAPILHPNAPDWFNLVIDQLQLRALRRALAIAEVPPGARLLDIGCGTGRWVRRYTELGFSPIGVDATIGMLRIAQAHGTSAPLTVGLAYDLPFSDAVFDVLSDITVLQHIPYDLQSKALQEMVRVLRPGGRIILLELLRGHDSHIFPRQPKEWVQEVESCGTRLVRRVGHEYFFLDRLFVQFAQALFRRGGDFIDQAQSTLPTSSTDKYSTSRRLYWKLRRTTVTLSALTETLHARICPVSMATHAVFVFRKDI